MAEMAAQNSTSSLVKRKSEDMALMPPPPPPKRIKRPNTVLDEDTYTDAVSKIIARDFFPGLLETEAQQEYLDALESKDNEWIREAGQNLRVAMTPDPYGQRHRRGTSMAQTPATVATTVTPGRTPLGPSSTPRGSSTIPSEAPEESERPQVDTSLSLNEFQAKYTSEDNASFNEVLDKQNEQRAKKYAHLRNNTNNLPSNRLMLYRKRETSQNLLAANDVSASTAVVLRPSEDLDARTASFDSFPTKQGARNNFMFAPDGVEDSLVTIAQAAEESSLAPPRRTNFAATRLPGPEAGPSALSNVPPSPSMSAVDDAIRGRPRLSASERGSEAGYSGAETPMVNGWRFVDEEPTAAEEAFTRGQPVDEEVAREAEREEMANYLPKLDGDGQAKGGFKMSAPSGREELLGRLVEKSSARERNKAVGSKKSSRDGAMTPAARSLAGKLGTPGRASGDWFGGQGGGKGDRKAWTPMRTPGVKR